MPRCSPAPALTNAVDPLMFRSSSLAIQLLESRVCSYHACYQSSTYSNISCRSSPRIRNCSLILPPARNGARHHSKSSHNSTGSTAVLLDCAHAQRRHDVPTFTCTTEIYCRTRSCVILSSQRAAPRPRDSPLRRTPDSTI